MTNRCKIIAEYRCLRVSTDCGNDVRDIIVSKKVVRDQIVGAVAPSRFISTTLFILWLNGACTDGSGPSVWMFTCQAHTDFVRLFCVRQGGGLGELVSPLPCGNNNETVTNGDGDAGNSALALFIVSSVLMGIGSVPLFVLGVTYIDDLAAHHTAAFYLG